MGIELLLLPRTPAALADTRVTVPASKSLTKTWFAPFAPDIRLVDADWNAIFVLSGENAPSWVELPLAGTPLASVDTSVTAPLAKSLTYTSELKLGTFGTRLVEMESNASFEPSGENIG